VSHLALLIPTVDRMGGAESQLLLLARGLARRGWRVTVVALSGSGGQAAVQLAADGIGFLSLAMRKGLADPCGWLRFHEWLARESPDVVHAHLPHAAWLGRWSRLLARTRVVVDTIHTASTGSLGRQLGYRWSDSLPDAVTAVSHAVADRWLQARMVDARHLHIVPNGIDLNHWKPQAAMRAEVRKELQLGDAFLWLAAGRLEGVKDYPTLLRAFALLNEPAFLFVAGSGPCEDSLRQLALDLRIAERVRFLGFQPDMRPWMQTADGFVLSSLCEGLPVAVLEAAACGVPTVATAVSGTTEAVQDGETGFLAPVNDPGALAAAMRRLMSAPADERRAMGVRARQRVAERYSLERVLDQWESLYGALLARAAASVTLLPSGQT